MAGSSGCFARRARCQRTLGPAILSCLRDSSEEVLVRVMNALIGIILSIAVLVTDLIPEYEAQNTKNWSLPP